MSYYFYISGNCSRYFPHPLLPEFDLTKESNTGEMGTFVYRIDLRQVECK